MSKRIRTIARTIRTLGQGVVTGIPPADADRDPIVLFAEWYRAAEESGILHPEAMALSTATPDGVPSSRMVLLKEVDGDDFVFYTNLESRKSLELAANPHAALVFHWAVLERQVRIEGTAASVSREQTEAYFASRPRGSRIGAWASRQSATLPDRTELEERVRHFEDAYPDEVPLPPNWGGWRVRPDRIEFWQGRTSRLHDRLLFERSEAGWTSRLLYP